jgi:dihydropteroate synthase
MVWTCRDRKLELGPRPLLMGILNVTPDSFSDGGRYLDPAAAADRALALAADGADIVDVGGESARPGAAPVGAGEEARRVLPVIRRLAGRINALISVDTAKAAVAEACLEAGAHIVNDVSALTADPRMPEVVRRFRAGAVLMHRQGDPATMQADPRYSDVAAEVRVYLADRLQRLEAEGLDPETLAVDPGIGFGKTVAHNLRLLTHTPALAGLGRPVVLGVSRKSFLGKLTGREVQDRLPASLGVLAYGVLRGARVLRVHDVRESRDVLACLEALVAEET